MSADKSNPPSRIATGSASWAIYYGFACVAVVLMAMRTYTALRITRTYDLAEITILIATV